MLVTDTRQSARVEPVPARSALTTRTLLEAPPHATLVCLAPRVSVALGSIQQALLAARSATKRPETACRAFPATVPRPPSALLFDEPPTQRVAAAAAVMILPTRARRARVTRSPPEAATPALLVCPLRWLISLLLTCPVYRPRGMWRMLQGIWILPEVQGWLWILG